MRENRLSGSEGGATLIGRPYPYLSGCPSGTNASLGASRARWQQNRNLS
jgi:hypothetical protein